VTDNPVLEQVVLEHLQFAPLSRAELARRTGASHHEVQAVLDQLVSDTFVVRRPQDGLPADYELTPNGAARLKMVKELFNSPFTAMGKAVGAAVVETQRRRRYAVRRPAGWKPPVRSRLLLSDADRSACSAALAEQFGIGRIDKAQLDRRTDLLYAAQTRGDLGAVFEGLPAPVLDKPPAPPAGTPKWRKVVHKIAIALSVPFLLMGAGLALTEPDLDDFIVGVILLGGGLVWNYLAWFWATRDRRSAEPVRVEGGR
jgi:DNA-binding HxlR family transcriptional regulator